MLGRRPTLADNSWFGWKYSRAPQNTKGFFSWRHPKTLVRRKWKSINPITPSGWLHHFSSNKGLLTTRGQQSRPFRLRQYVHRTTTYMRSQGRIFDPSLLMHSIYICNFHRALLRSSSMWLPCYITHLYCKSDPFWPISTAIWIGTKNDPCITIAHAELHVLILGVCGRVDDVEDNSTLRRGFPVAHSLFGVAQTINSGNYVYFCAMREITRLKNPECARMFTGMVYSRLQISQMWIMSLTYNQQRNWSICTEVKEWTCFGETPLLALQRMTILRWSATVCALYIYAFSASHLVPVLMLRNTHLETGGLFRLAIKLMQAESESNVWGSRIHRWYTRIIKYV